MAVAAVTVLLAAVRPCGTGTALIDQLRELADLKSAAAALQARITVAFDGLERGAQAGAGLPAAELGTGVDPTRQPRRHRTACQSPPGPGHHDVPDCPAPGRLRRRCARRPSLGTPTPCARTGIRGPIEIQLVTTDRTLFQGDSDSACLPGYGVMAAGRARNITRNSASGAADTPPAVPPLPSTTQPSPTLASLLLPAPIRHHSRVARCYPLVDPGCGVGCPDGHWPVEAIAVGGVTLVLPRSMLRQLGALLALPGAVAGMIGGLLDRGNPGPR